MSGLVKVVSDTEQQLRQLIRRFLPTIDANSCQISLVEGLSGKSWRIADQKVSLLARPQTVQRQQLGINRRREAAALKRCGPPLAPRVILQQAGWLLVEWLPGECVDPETFNACLYNGQLAATMAQLHQCGCSGYRINLQQQFAAYWQQIDRRRLTPRWLAWQRYFSHGNMPTPLMLAPLHMDIHADNLLHSAGKLQLIDWEYAADGDIALELAALFRFNQFSSTQQRLFLSDYSQHGYRDLARLTQQIARWAVWVDYLMLMWFEVRWQQSQDSALLQQGAALYRQFCLPTKFSC